MKRIIEISMPAVSAIFLFISPLLCSGPSEKAQDNFFTAAYNGDTKVIKKMVSQGVDVNMKDTRGGDGNVHTALTYAASRNRFDTVDFLVSKGAKLYPSVLDWTVSTGSVRMVQHLLNLKADPNGKSNTDWTPLMTACQRGDFSIVRLLVEFGADKKSESVHGQTPVAIAEEKGFNEIVAYLKK